MTGRGRELVQVCEKKNIDTLCVFKKKNLGGKSARELGDGYKLYYGGAENKRKGVGIILSPKYKESVMKVVSPLDKLIQMKLIVEGGVYNIVSAYAPQTGETSEMKEKFMQGFEDMVLSVAQTEKVIIGADLNGHVGKEEDGFNHVHRRKGYGQRNRDGDRILECAESLTLALANTFYEKPDEHLITYKSG